MFQACNFMAASTVAALFLFETERKNTNLQHYKSVLHKPLGQSHLQCNSIALSRIYFLSAFHSRDVVTAGSKMIW